MTTQRSKRPTDINVDNATGNDAARFITGIAASVRRERERLGLSIGELARRSEISKSTLSQIESGSGNPSIETLWMLANALSVPVSRFIEVPRRGVELIRRGEGPKAASSQADYTAALLAASPVGVRRDVYQLCVQPGQPKISQSHMPGTVEHLIISSGRALAGLANAPVDLGPGDYVSYPADEPHVFRALEQDTYAVLIIESV
ncbi:helix-turn-helix domain-containing protein [Noviherbaspirillum sp. Root189]|uniref:helix-turn-helix domain-containing protein n=1 Tax=Noviherbaspirillum sp. Root189 TaxID=1736487 RepID=UPI0009E7494F|nr:helix-turn-helix domain-containing protein [Noviherbaspirillum sp. Root189]